MPPKLSCVLKNRLSTRPTRLRMPQRRLNVESQGGWVPFSTPDRLDGADRIVSRTPGKADIRATRYLMSRSNYGLTPPTPVSDTQFVAVHLRAFGAQDMWCDNRYLIRPAVGPGGIGIYDFRRSWRADLRDPFHTINFEFPQWKVDELTDELRVPRIDTLRCPPGTHDEVIHHMALALLPTLEKPWEANSLFVDYTLAATCTYLVRTYGELRKPMVRPSGFLAPWQERRVRELLTSNLVRDVPLSELAEACGLSVSYFSRAFRQSLGMPPHRWLLEQRVGRAKELLEHTAESLSDVAMSCGFADQSHFTRVFSRLAGCSPGAWRRMNRT
jgi:AraC family transcriptional regulator